MRRSSSSETMRKGSEAATRAISATLRGRAAEHGLPPILAVATSISTAVYGNMVAYRGSEPITAGQYYQIITGEGRPKAVTRKEKSSNLEVTNGYLVENPVFGRYDKQPDGKYALRPDKPPEGLERNQLEIPLRKIYNGLGDKFELVGAKNPDDQGNLRFRQINHESEDVRALVYCVNVKDVKPVSPEIIAHNKLVSNEYKNLNIKGEPDANSPFYGLSLDAMCKVSGQQPVGNGYSDPQPIVVLGGIVRDCDIDWMTVPPRNKLYELLRTEETQKYLEPLDMSAHGKDDVQRANDATVEMVTRIMEIHDQRWETYNHYKQWAGHQPGSDAEKKWERDHAEMKPFVAEDATQEMITAMVVTVGKGTPLQLYQALEINIVEQKILASSTKLDGTKVNVADLSSENQNIRNAALMQVHEQKIEYSKDTISRSFLQHPGENYNEHYTSKRSPSVAVSGSQIVTAEDKAMSQIILNKDQYVAINPKWIAENSPGNDNAAVWVSHFMAKSDTHYKNEPVVKEMVDKFLANPRNLEYIEKKLEDFDVYPKATGASAAKDYLTRFIENHPEVKTALAERKLEREAKTMDVDVADVQTMKVRN